MFQDFWLIEILTAKAKHSVRPRTIILPGDGRCQFDQFWRREPLLQPLTQFGNYFRRRRSNGVRQFQHQFFVSREKIAFRIPVQIADLLVT